MSHASQHDPSSALDLPRLAATLRTRRFGRSLDYRALTESTNDDAKRALAASAADGHVVVADGQRAGRGARGHSWDSPAGTDLYVSIVDRPRVALADLPPLTLAVGLAVAETVDALLSASAERTSLVKWPNDVLVADRKLAGILIETSLGPSEVDGVVIGIGLNVNREQFPDELRARATSLHLCHPERARIDRTAALATLLERVEARVDQFVAQGPGSITAELAPRLAYVGRRVSCAGEVGHMRGVAPTGVLLLEGPGGLRSMVVGPLEPLD